MEFFYNEDCSVLGPVPLFMESTTWIMSTKVGVPGDLGSFPGGTPLSGTVFLV